MPSRPPVLLCRCPDAEVIPPARFQAALDQIRTAGASVQILDSLCALCALQPGRIADLLLQTPPGILIACFPRAVRSLLLRAPDITPAMLDRWTFVNLRGMDPDDIAPTLNRLLDSPGDSRPSDPPPPLRAPEPDRPSPPGAPPWDPWFPVIDPNRCRRCGQCVNFCLFGVYAGQPGDLPQVVQPENCKNRCPACARICPDAAIIFPRHPDGPINGDTQFDQHRPDEALQAIQTHRPDALPLIERLKQRRHSRAGTPPPA